MSGSQYIRNCNPTLRAVASLCAQAKPGKRTFMANPLIHAVVTFNLDALLQAYVLARFHQRLLRTVERSSVKPYLDAINLYHLHGYLRFDRYSGDPSKEGLDTIVLTEQEYFDFFNSPTSMFNYTFLYLLREHPCLFIGLSMQDENLRRLLHYSCRERQSSFRGKQRREPHWLRHFAILQSTDYPDMDRLTEVSLNQLGVRTLWIKQFTDIPKRLGNVYESAGGSWQRVYGTD